MRQREREILTAGGVIGICAAAAAGSLLMLVRLAEWICWYMQEDVGRLLASTF